MKGCKDRFAVGLDRGIKAVRWDGVSPLGYVESVVFRVDEMSSNIMNHAKADPKSRLYTGN